uniref:Uncharacterized protein n=1 Tax=Aegilops tauschii subsp. strangulata TaxID=200361 RepID=A0A453EWQ3_AEGTS
MDVDAAGRIIALLPRRSDRRRCRCLHLYHVAVGDGHGPPIPVLLLPSVPSDASPLFHFSSRLLGCTPCANIGLTLTFLIEAGFVSIPIQDASCTQGQLSVLFTQRCTYIMRYGWIR